LQLCDQVHIKAAERLGMNRNTLHKKWTEYFGQKPAEGGGE
jgi:DNA-binding protein Fis